MTATMSPRGARRHMEIIHWEDVEATFPRNITPTDVDWQGFVDYAGVQVEIEFKHENKTIEPGQARAFIERRKRMLPGDWWLLVRHTGVSFHVFPTQDITALMGWQVNDRPNEPSYVGHGWEDLEAFLRAIDGRTLIQGAADVGVPVSQAGGDTGTPPPSSQLEPAPTAIAGDVPASWVAAMRLAARIHATPFVPRPLRGDPHSVLACILTGAELGLGPMTSLRMVNVIEGRPAASAELMRALVNRQGHLLSVVEAKQDKVTLFGKRSDTGAHAKVTWTLADAQRAKLTGNPAWGKYPRSMLLARATSELCRMLFADVIGGLYTEEETAAIEGVAWEPDDPAELVDPVTQRDLTEGVSHDPGDAGEQISPAPAESGEAEAGAHLRAEASPDQPTLDDVEPDRSVGQSDAR